MIPIAGLIQAGMSIIDKIIPDPKQKAEAKLKLLSMEQEGELSKIANQTKVIVAEAKSESWLARTWRPITALSFTFIVINNYIIFPYLNSLGIHAVSLPIPPKMWSLLEIMIGGYVVGRSIEKGVSAWKNK